MTNGNEPSFDLTNKVAIVTGGSRGLGREMSLAFGRHGANVVVASRKEQPCIELAKEITDLTGNEAVGIGCHVGHWDQCDQLVDATYERFGHVDVLVNNAGMSPLYPSLPEVSEDLYDKVLAVNLKGPFRLSALVGSRMVDGDGGVIINVSSVAAVAPGSIELPYAMAKAGLNNLTIGLARTFGPKVRANCIMAGPFLTDISKAWDESFVETAHRMMPLRRAGEPEEIVGAALYLASSASSFTTGAILKVDGGAAISPA